MKVVSNLVYNKTYGERGLGDLYLPDEITPETPLALAIHGGGWSAMEKSSFAGVAQFLCRLGFAVYNTHYRLTTIAPWPACGDDCIEAAKFFLTANRPEFAGLTRKKLLIAGASAGGHLAVMTGLRLPPEQVSGIVSISGIGDLLPDFKFAPGRYTALFGHSAPFSDEEFAHASPLSYLNPDNPPILWTHAIYDNVVPVESAANLEDGARACGGRFESYYYNRKNDGHCIWIPNSNPHQLHPDIEERIRLFISTL